MNIKQKISKFLLKVLPQFFINYLYNSGFAYGTEHGIHKGLTMTADDKENMRGIIVLHKWCDKCGDTHQSPSVNLEKWFSEKPQRFRIDQDLIDISNWKD